MSTITTISGGTLPTPSIEWVTQGVTRDESYTPEYYHSMILNSAQIAALRPGANVMYGMSGVTITEIGRPTYLWPNAFRVNVTTIAEPQGYEQQIFVTAQFLPSRQTVLPPTEAQALARDSQPFVVETDGRDVVAFIRSEQSPLLAAPNPERPLFRNQQVNHYGATYSEAGIFLGWTTPRIPPMQIVVDRRIDKWRPGWNRITTVFARRPL